MTYMYFITIERGITLNVMKLTCWIGFDIHLVRYRLVPGKTMLTTGTCGQG